MNKYKVVKYVWGESISDVIEMEKNQDIIYIELNEGSKDGLGFQTEQRNG